jgi:hypothetical protein
MLVLFCFLVLFDFLLAIAVVVHFVAEHERVAVHFVQDGALEYLHRLAFGPFALADFPVVLPGFEHHAQPGSHLLDRGQLAGKTGFAACTGRALRPHLTLRTLLAALALRAGLAVKASLSGMALLSTWTLSPLSGYRILRHARNSLNDSSDNRLKFVDRGGRRKSSALLININRPRGRPGHGKMVSRSGGDGFGAMNPGWKIIWLAGATFAVACGAAWLLVPDIVPVSYVEEPQPSWAVLTAFVLRAIELTAAWMAAITIVVVYGAWREAGGAGRSADGRGCARSSDSRHPPSRSIR